MNVILKVYFISNLYHIIFGIDYINYHIKEYYVFYLKLIM